jgi:hypothetical protein
MRFWGKLGDEVGKSLVQHTHTRTDPAEVPPHHPPLLGPAAAAEEPCATARRPSPPLGGRLLLVEVGSLVDGLEGEGRELVAVGLVKLRGGGGGRRSGGMRGR